MATNATGNERQYWGVLPVMDGRMLAAIAKQSEDARIEGMFAPQVFGPRFSRGVPASAG